MLMEHQIRPKDILELTPENQSVKLQDKDAQFIRFKVIKEYGSAFNRDGDWTYDRRAAR